MSLKRKIIADIMSESSYEDLKRAKARASHRRAKKTALVKHIVTTRRYPWQDAKIRAILDQKIVAAFEYEFSYDADKIPMGDSDNNDYDEVYAEVYAGKFEEAVFQKMMWFGEIVKSAERWRAVSGREFKIGMEGYLEHSIMEGYTLEDIFSEFSYSPDDPDPAAFEGVCGMLKTLFASFAMLLEAVSKVRVNGIALESAAYELKEYISEFDEWFNVVGFANIDVILQEALDLTTLLPNASDAVEEAAKILNRIVKLLNGAGVWGDNETLDYISEDPEISKAVRNPGEVVEFLTGRILSEDTFLAIRDLNWEDPSGDQERLEEIVRDRLGEELVYDNDFLEEVSEAAQEVFEFRGGEHTSAVVRTLKSEGEEFGVAVDEIEGWNEEHFSTTAFEFKFNPMALGRCIENMYGMCRFIDAYGNTETSDDAIGLHMNMSVRGMKMTLSTLDLYKLYLFIEEEKLFKDWRKVQWAVPTLSLSASQVFTVARVYMLGDLEMVAHVMKEFIISSRAKTHAMNIMTLERDVARSTSRVEFRTPGGNNYHKAPERIEFYAYRYGYMMWVAFNKAALSARYKAYMLRDLNARVQVQRGNIEKALAAKGVKASVSSMEDLVEVLTKHPGLVDKLT